MNAQHKWITAMLMVPVTIQREVSSALAMMDMKEMESTAQVYYITNSAVLSLSRSYVLPSRY